ncbi:hypothetical protein HBZC1_p0030 (plasmid) [Helicobacter bizzozeronii CIII-1]|uniref:Transmembrane protein n=1 Tax=Helicobacter bizzozeronii (strain CIII-1) TaxID=1002804 RepID=F8KUE8_HELBC|nr:hypothetical protein HBZC1_p0030 [Helicobacter bizzozeronii CIII-1]
MGVVFGKLAVCDAFTALRVLCLFGIVGLGWWVVLFRGFGFGGLMGGLEWGFGRTFLGLLMGLLINCVKNN